MAFDELELMRIDKSVGALCRRLTPPEHKAELEFIYAVEGQCVSIYEVRPGWKEPEKKTRMGVARFRYIRTRQEWTLYWMRRDLKWHLYDPDVSVSRSLDALVKVVAEDRSGAFFG